MKVAGLLLAAGAGRRFGRPKATVEHDGMTLVERGARLLADGGCAPVVVVAGAAAGEVVEILGRLRLDGPHPPAVRVVVAQDWMTGMAASLRAGLAELGGTDAEAAVVTLVDQPRLGAAAVRRLVTAARADSEADAAVATYAGAVGHPVLLCRRIWPEVAASARGEVGARAWLRAHPDRVRQVPCDGTGSPADADTAADLDRPAPAPAPKNTFRS